MAKLINIVSLNLTVPYDAVLKINDECECLVLSEYMKIIETEEGIVTQKWCSVFWVQEPESTELPHDVLRDELDPIGVPGIIDEDDEEEGDDPDDGVESVSEEVEEYEDETPIAADSHPPVA